MITLSFWYLAYLKYAYNMHNISLKYLLFFEEKKEPLRTL